MHFRFMGQGNQLCEGPSEHDCFGDMSNALKLKGPSIHQNMILVRHDLQSAFTCKAAVTYRRNSNVGRSTYGSCVVLIAWRSARSMDDTRGASFPNISIKHRKPSIDQQPSTLIILALVDRLRLCMTWYYRGPGSTRWSRIEPEKGTCDVLTLEVSEHTGRLLNCILTETLRVSTDVSAN